MRAVPLTVLLLWLQALSAEADEFREVNLKLPQALKARETAFLIVQVQSIGPGKEVEVTTASGHELGVISSYGWRSGEGTGTYALPVPSDAFANEGLVIQLRLNQGNKPSRAPTTNEVTSVTMKISSPQAVSSNTNSQQSQSNQLQSPPPTIDNPDPSHVMQTKFPAVGHKYLVNFVAFKVQLYFTSETSMTYTGIKADGSQGGSETVTIKVELIADNIFLVTWQEADKTTVVHIENYDAKTIVTNITNPDNSFDQYHGTFVQLQ